MRKLKGLFILCLCLLFAIGSTCLAGTPSGDLNGFVDAFESGVNPNTLWGSLIPIVSIMVTAFLFAFVWGRFGKVSKSASNGKFRIK